MFELFSFFLIIYSLNLEQFLLLNIAIQMFGLFLIFGTHVLIVCNVFDCVCKYGIMVCEYDACL